MAPRTASLWSSGSSIRPALQKAAADLLGSWKSAGCLHANHERVRGCCAHQRRKSRRPTRRTRSSRRACVSGMRDSDPDYPAMVMANYMFGGGGLTARFPDRVRNREGLSYSVSSGFTAPVDGDAAAFSVSAIANPGNTPKVEASFLDELARTLRDGFTAEELRRGEGRVSRRAHGQPVERWRHSESHRRARALGPHSRVGRSARREAAGAHARPGEHRVSPERGRQADIHREGWRFQGGTCLSVSARSLSGR